MMAFFDWIREILGDYRYLLLYGIFLALGLVCLKEKRKVFLFPALLITVLILNPWMKEFWEKINDYGYWRMLWILPLIPVCAAVPAGLMEKTRKISVKIIAVVMALILFVLAGSMVYETQNATFTRATNADKLPQDVTEIAQALLEIDEHPRVVADPAIATYLRQYSGRFRMPYARDIEYGNPTPYARELCDALMGGLLDRVAQMIKSQYSYLVTANQDPQRREQAEAAGFELLRQVNGYGIYRLKES